MSSQYLRLCGISTNIVLFFCRWYIIGDEQGVVKFFDSKFRIVRWTKSSPQLASRPITCIACNQTDGLADFKKEMRKFKFYTEMPQDSIFSISTLFLRVEENFGRRQDRKQIVKDWTYGGEKYKQASQTTLERPPLIAPDFVIG